ncbi:FtsX-like permease family protein [Cellulomonas sp. 179-A 4D5 NHS]|uniref:FtsX-like permease family protein n=1 Tax=Cellulomonas sp. 179-A 4D5 NHS TaxID=3142378 RepID=UPI0039A28134
MGWTMRLLAHRALTQASLLVTVLAVAVLGSGLLGTFGLLLTESEARSLQTALGREPLTATDIDVEVTPGAKAPLWSIGAAEDVLATVTEGVPTTYDRWISSVPYRIPAGDLNPAPLAYVAAQPALDDRATLVEGRWPAAAADGDGRIEIAVPVTAAEAFGWSAGSAFPLTSSSSRSSVDAVVVGVFERTGALALWERDLLDGALVDRNFPVPGSFGFVKTTAYGPFVALPEVLTDQVVETQSARVVAHPRLEGATPATLAELPQRVEDARPALIAALSDVALGGYVLTELATTVEGARTQLAVTRVGLAVLGIMLAVLAVTVLLIAARLLAERRVAERTLLTSRGASTRQLVRFAGIEALAIAALTSVLAPFVARALYGAVVAQPVLAAAGLDHDPGLPLQLLVTCASAAVLFAAVLLAPLLRRSTSAVDDEQQLVRQEGRGSFARSGLDLALVALAGVAFWQLRVYRSPVVEGGGIDPVLVAGPALFLLAGGALTLRVAPLVARGVERLARRSRSLVLPLAAWEVSRRPARASGAVLLLTLAVAVSSFSQSFLATWRVSQADQAELRVGTDVRVDGLAGTPFDQSVTIGALPGATVVSPVTSRSVRIGRPVTDSQLPSTNKSIDLLAVDTVDGPAVLRGRSTHPEGWVGEVERLAPEDPVRGPALPGTPEQVELTLAASVTPALTGTQVLVTVTLQDAHGARMSFELDPMPADGTPVQQTVAVAAAGARLATPLSVVALVGQVYLPADAVVALGDALPVAPPNGSSPLIFWDLDVTDLRARTGGTASEPVAFVADEWSGRSLPNSWGIVTPVDLTAGDAGALSARGTLPLDDMIEGGRGFSVTAFEAPEYIPVIASDAMLDLLESEVGNEALLAFGAVTVPVRLVAGVPHVPGSPTRPAALADHDTLWRALAGIGLTDPMIDEWWAAVPDDGLAPALADVRGRDDGTIESRVEVRDLLTDGPLRVGMQAALWIVTIAAVALAIAGFLMSATVSVRLRRLELARLQALGASRGALVRAVLAEHGLLAVLGSAAGLLLGLLLGHLVAPLLTVAADGRRPVPPVLVQWPWADEAVLLLSLLAAIAITVGVTTMTLLRRASAELLRLGDDR